MAKLPQVTGPQAVAAFGKVGFRLVRVSASHHILAKEGHPKNLSVPVHGSKPVAPGTLRKLIRDAGLTVEAFTALLS